MDGQAMGRASEVGLGRDGNDAGYMADMVWLERTAGV